jgi:hypothetical protein
VTRRLTALVVVAAALIGVVGALALWTTGGTGSASASVGTLDPASISAVVSGTGAVTLTWGGQAAMTPASANGGITYSVERRLGAGAFAQVSGGACAGSLAFATSSCVDVPGASGSYTYRVTARYGGAWSALSNEVTVVVVADTDPPTTTLTFPSDGAAYNAIAYAAGCFPVGLCGTAQDISGVAVVRLSIQKLGSGYWTGSGFSGFSEVFHDAGLLSPGATSTDWSLPLTISTGGRYVVHVQASDTHGNDSAPGATSSATFTVDVDAPSTSISTIPASPDGSNGWFRQATVGFTLAAVDQVPYGSGVAGTWYRIDGGPAQAYTGPVSISGQGEHTVVYWSVDNAGNAETPSTAHVRLDGVDPATTVALSPSAPNGANGWYTTAPTFALASSDATSGVATTSYRIDAGSATTYPGSPVAVPEGQHTISYWSTDTAGNVETAHTTAPIRVDTVRPSTTIATVPASADGSNGWFRQTSVSFTLTGSDATSGVASLHYTIDGGAAHVYSGPVTVATPGDHVVAYWAVDAAGNVEAPGTAHVRLDAVAPATTATTTPAAPNGSNGWFSQSSVTLALGATDATSGVAATSYSLDGGSTLAYTGPIAVSTQGDHTIDYWSTDTAGNVEATHTVHVKLDNAAPSVTLDTNPASPDGTNGWFVSSASFTLSAADAASGVASRLYRLDGGSAQTYTGPVSLSQGDHTIEYWAVDQAGNTSTHTTTHVKLDSAKPVTTLTTTPGSPDGSNGWFRQASVSFTLSASDATSGVATRLYTIDGGSAQTYSGAVTIAAQGDHTLTYWSVDNAGNTESAHTTHVKLDNVAPTVSVSLTAAGSALASGGTIYYRRSDSVTANRTLKLRATVADATSQPASASFPNISTTGWTHAAEGPVTTPGSGVYDSSAFTWTTSAANPTGYAITVADQAGNVASQSLTFANDSTSPTNALALGPSSTGAFLSGGTLYFKSNAPGSFTLQDAVTDTGVGPASVTFPGIATSGWTHAAETVTAGSGTAPTIAYASSPFGWTAGAGTPTGTVTATDGVGNSTSTSLTFVPDVTGPTGGALVVNGTAASSAGTTSVDGDGSFTIGTRTDYSADAGSGLATSVLTSESATLAADGTTCGAFGTPATIAGSPTQSGLAEGCYRYTLTGTDKVGNTSSIGTTVKVDRTPPTVTLTAVQDGPGGTEIFTGTTTELTGPITIHVYWLGFISVQTYTFTPASTSWSFQTDSSDLWAILTYTARAEQTDAAGNTSALSNTITFHGNS